MMGKASARWAVSLPLTAMVVAALLSDPAWAGFEEGVAAYSRGDHARAVRAFLPLAQAGHAPAQRRLGGMDENGLGVPQDYTEAVKWSRRAAEQGDPLDTN